VHAVPRGLDVGRARQERQADAGLSRDQPRVRGAAPVERAAQPSARAAEQLRVARRLVQAVEHVADARRVLGLPGRCGARQLEAGDLPLRLAGPAPRPTASMAADSQRAAERSESR
jgi:hypothetical protein